MIHVLISSNTNWLTQKGDVPIELRIFVRKAVGANATPEYWEEWSEEKKLQWEAEHPIEQIEETEL